MDSGQKPLDEETAVSSDIDADKALGNGGVGTGAESLKESGASGDEAGEGECRPPAAPSPEEAASRRQKRITAASLGAVLLIALALAGVGLASGWFSSEGLFKTTQEAAGPSASQGDEGVSPSSPDNGQGDSDSNAASSPQDDGGAAPAGAAGPQPDGGAGSTGSPSPDTSAPPDAAGGGTSTPAPPPAQPAPQPSPAPAPTPAPATITVSVYVDSSQAVSYGYPACLASKSVTLDSGASVYDALCATGVAVGGSSSYVRSIGGLAEFACGATSGWLYSVNGVSPGYSCGAYLLYGGESIVWLYTLQA